MPQSGISEPVPVRPATRRMGLRVSGRTGPEIAKPSPVSRTGQSVSRRRRCLLVSSASSSARKDDCSLLAGRRSLWRTGATERAAPCSTRTLLTVRGERGGGVWKEGDPVMHPDASIPLAQAGAALVHRLGGHWHHASGMCHCPAHDDRTPSLSVRVGSRALLFKCFAGCSNEDIFRSLRAQGIAVPRCAPPSGRIRESLVRQARWPLERRTPMRHEPVWPQHAASECGAPNCRKPVGRAEFSGPAPGGPARRGGSSRRRPRRGRGRRACLRRR